MKHDFSEKLWTAIWVYFVALVVGMISFSTAQAGLAKSSGATPTIQVHH